LCLKNIEFPKKAEDKKGLNKIKVTFIDRIQERIYILKGWKSYTHNRLKLITSMKTHLTEVSTENKLDFMQKINTATDVVKIIPTEMENIFKSIKNELDQVLQNIFEDFITKTDGILDETMKILIDTLRVPQIPMDNVVNKEAGTKLYTVDGDHTTFYIFIGETDYFHLIGQLDTGVRNIFSNFLDNFFHVGLVDLILGSIRILCLINALVSMIYLCKFNRKLTKIEKMPVSKKILKNIKGKSKKESAASQHFRTQKQKEQLENMEKKARRARKQMAETSIPLRGGYMYETVPLHLVPSISEMV